MANELPHMPTPAAAPRRRPLPGVLVLAVFLCIFVPLAIVAAYTLFFSKTATSIDPAREALAASLAGAPVQPLTGPLHTVYFSAQPLPGAAAPRADGRFTLVWFSSTNCRDCQRMESFVYTAAQQFSSRLVFLEKAVNRDSAAARYSVDQTPTFLLLDATGTEVVRFGYQPSADAFSQAITRALK